MLDLKSLFSFRFFANSFFSSTKVLAIKRELSSREFMPYSFVLNLTRQREHRHKDWGAITLVVSLMFFMQETQVVCAPPAHRMP